MTFFRKIANWFASLFIQKPQIEQIKHPTGWNEDWEILFKPLIVKYLEVLNKASDVIKFNADYFKLNNEQQIKVWIEFFKWLSYFESGWNPNSQSVDVGKVWDKDTYSIGLFQMSVIDQKSYGLPLGFDFKALLEPKNNFDLAISILALQITKYGRIFISWNEKSKVYWATLSPGNPYDHSVDILRKVNALKFNSVTIPEQKKESESIEPKWLTIAKKEIGIKEISGNKHNPRILEYHKATTLKATDDETPWCSSFVCWCLEQAGIKSTKNAWARSYLNWGEGLIKPKYGCIVVFSRGPDSGHVGFFMSETKDMIQVISGNQNDSVCIKDYPKSKLLGYRWPREVELKMN